MKDMLGVILLTQRRHGEILLEAARFITDAPMDAVAISLLGNESQSEIESRLHSTLADFPNRDVLILCDLFGSTHAVIAGTLARQNKHVACVCGLNLPMLMEVCTARTRPLKTAAVQVAKAGRRAIVACGME